MIDGFFVEGVFPLFGEVETMVSGSLPLDIRLVSALSGCPVNYVWDSYVETVDFEIISHLLITNYDVGILIG